MLKSKQSNFIEITLQHGFFPVNLLHIFRTPFPKDTSGRLFLTFPLDFMNTFQKFSEQAFYRRLTINCSCIKQIAEIIQESA